MKIGSEIGTYRVSNNTYDILLRTRKKYFDKHAGKTAGNHKFNIIQHIKL